MQLTHLLVVRDLEVARSFYRDVLGATVFREYGGSSCVLEFLGTWLLLVTGGGPTPDKPTVTFAPPNDPDHVSHEMTIRVPSCRVAYETLASRGAVFLTPPIESAWEIRAFFRDPDGHLIEISEAK
jgi:catechol 2,3-dioxygenase-like lactoylglutathione lyase family enzyme